MNVLALTAPNPGPYTLDGTRTYVIAGEAVVDPGPAVDSHVEAILAAAPDLRTIFITHRHADHAPAAVPLQERTGARIVAPQGVVPAADAPLRDGDRFEVAAFTITAIATPGHTAEHFCFLSSDGDLFTGDTVLGEGTTAIFPPDGDMGAYIQSLRRLRELAPARIWPGHGPMREDAVTLLDEYIEHRLAREREVLGALHQGLGEVPRIRERIYPDLHPALARAAELQIEAHLEKLASEGRARRVTDGWSG